MGINKRYLERMEQMYSNVNYTNPEEAIIYINSPIYYENWMLIPPILFPELIPNKYYISSFGRVFSVTNPCKSMDGKFLQPSHNGHGYQQITFKCYNGDRRCCKIARLVKMTFDYIPNCYLYEIDHLDGNKDNNFIGNLQWVTPQENVHRAIKNGLRPLSCNVNSGTLLTDNQARELYCRAKSGEDRELLSNEYKVSEKYIKGLLSGSIRPYISKELQ